MMTVGAYVLGAWRAGTEVGGLRLCCGTRGYNDDFSFLSEENERDNCLVIEGNNLTVIAWWCVRH